MARYLTGDSRGPRRRQFLQVMTVGLASVTAGCAVEVGDFSIGVSESDDSGQDQGEEPMSTMTPTATLTPTSTPTPTPTLTPRLEQNTPTPTSTSTPTPTATPIPQREQKISNGDGGDHFGFSVALDGDTALVGAHFDEHPNSSGAGSAYVFTRSGSRWTQQAKLAPEDGDDGDHFGWAVALDGDTALVGARDDEHPNGFAAGSAYVFWPI